MGNNCADTGMPNPGGLKAIILSGLTAGFLDITAASVNIWLNGGQGPILSGVFYGIADWLFKSLVVLPLSAWKVSTYSFSSVATGIFIHIFFVGLPIALITHRFSK